MSQSDLNIDNVSRSLFRAEVNASLQALASLNAGATATTTTYAYQLWADTTTGILKIRNAANDDWNTLFELDASDLVKIGANSTITSLTGLTTPLSESQGGTGTSAGNFNFKNRIINGAMMIDQRNAGASVTPANGATTYVVDRFKFYVNQASKLTAQQSTTAPAGFTNSLLITSSSAYSPSGTDIFNFEQTIEGFNVADLGWGTANAQPITISFWVRSSVTGTFGGALLNSAQNRSYPFTFTINSANTFEQKSITVAGDTSGTWLTNNGSGLTICLSMGAGTTYRGTAGAWAGTAYYSATGAVSLVATSGATFYITGYQLEKGSTATSFDYRPYGTELALCQRYYLKNTIASGTTEGTFLNGVVSGTTSAARCVVYFPVAMRASPTFNYSNLRIYDGGALPSVTSIALNRASTLTACIDLVGSGGGLTLGRSAMIIETNTSAFSEFSAEL